MRRFFELADRLAHSRNAKEQKRLKAELARLTFGYPIELYTEERIAEFERENTIPAELSRRVERLAKGRRGKKR